VFLVRPENGFNGLISGALVAAGSLPAFLGPFGCKSFGLSLASPFLSPLGWFWPSSFYRFLCVTDSREKEANGRVDRVGMGD
jgi:hypothetical protein